MQLTTFLIGYFLNYYFDSYPTNCVALLYVLYGLISVSKPGKIRSLIYVVLCSYIKTDFHVSSVTSLFKLTDG